jgi:hypothetical protein
VTSDKTYCFQVCAVRTLASREKIQSPLSPVLSFTIPSEEMQTVSTENQVSEKKDTQPKEFSEKELAGIFFVGFAFVVLFISLIVSFFVS